MKQHLSYMQSVWHAFKAKPVGMLGFIVLLVFIFVALYAPFLASSKPLVVVYDGHVYFPLFRYLFSSVFFTKKIDLFFNILGVFLPIYLLLFWVDKKRKWAFFAAVSALMAALFIYFGFFVSLDPANSVYLNERKEALVLQLTSKSGTLDRGRMLLPSWDIDLEYMNDYAKLNLVLANYNKRISHAAIVSTLKEPSIEPYTLFWQEATREKQEIQRLQKALSDGHDAYEKARVEEEQIKDQLRAVPPTKRSITMSQKCLQLEDENEAYEEMQNRLEFIQERRAWIEQEEGRISYILWPLFSTHYWEDDVGGEQALNILLPFTEDTRINRKDLLSALIFGCRISLFVGFGATLLALGIGLPLGLISGYYGSKLDIVLCRFVEVWEAMPVFFMLLLVISILQTKSIFVVIAVISVFSWMSSFRFVRAETFRQRQMLYVDASRAIGFPGRFILLHHILPNSIF